MQISIIIPTFNEEQNIGNVIRHLLKRNELSTDLEIIVIDANSKDNTAREAESAGAKVVLSDKKGRAAQMNIGASLSKGEVLYFVHADVFPPESYVADIFTALDSGFEAGCYRFLFDSDKSMLKINSYFTRFNGLMFRGGDQTLFITRQLFEQLGGFDENFVIMEDFNLVQRARKSARFRLMPKEVIVSDRKYQDNNYLRVTFANFVVFIMFLTGFSPNTLLNSYRSLIRQSKTQRY